MTIVALLLLVQFLLAGLSLGAHAAPVPLDHFGNVLCAEGVDAADHSGGTSGDHRDASDCCSMGCQASGTAFAPSPGEAAIALGRPVPRASPVIVFSDLGPTSVETPCNAQAPPLPI